MNAFGLQPAAFARGCEANLIINKKIVFSLALFVYLLKNYTIFIEYLQ